VLTEYNSKPKISRIINDSNTELSNKEKTNNRYNKITLNVNNENEIKSQN